MKKILAFILAMIMMLSFAACSGNDAPVEENNGEGENTEETVSVGSALEVLETVWGMFGEDEKFFVVGGDFDVQAADAPGTATDPEYIKAYLYVPEAELANVSETASMVHGMNLNTFTVGAYKVTDAAAFAETMHSAISDVQWMCGFPDKMVIATIGNEYAVVLFGVNDAVNPFTEKLTAAYPETVVVYDEAIA